LLKLWDYRLRMRKWELGREGRRVGHFSRRQTQHTISVVIVVWVTVVEA
jgi:hypothetical protein